MGQQQLLLIVLSVIIVGIAVVVGINMFSASAASSNLEAVSNDLLNLSSRAQQYYVKPSGLGGGGNAFTGLSADAAGLAKLTPKATNDNGTYSISTAGNATSVTIQGVGNQDGDGDGTNCTIQIQVFSDSLATTIVNR
jgi:Tfp pilus assembly protein PilE